MVKEMELEDTCMQMEIFMKVNGIKTIKKDEASLKLNKEIITEVIGRQIISTAKDNISLLMVIIIKGIFMKVQDRVKESIFGRIKVVMMVTGRQTRWKDMANIQLPLELLLRDGFKRISL